MEENREELMVTEDEDVKNELFVRDENNSESKGSGALWMLAGAALTAGVYAGIKAVRKAIQKGNLKKEDELYLYEEDGFDDTDVSDVFEDEELNEETKK